MTPRGNLFVGLPAAGSGEQFCPLWERPGVRVERIVSRGHTTPPGEWYDQPADEWVVVLAGAARLAVEGQPGEIDLSAGDWVLLPARLRHRVAWTDPNRDTVWLAVHAGG